MREGHRPLEPAAARVRENQIWCALVSLACELTAWAQLLAFTTPDSANRSRPARRGAARRWEDKRLRLPLLPAGRAGSNRPLLGPPLPPHGAWTPLS